MRIAIVEFIDEAKGLIDFCKSSNVPFKDVLAIALAPSVKVYLSNQGFDVRSTMDYFDNDSHRRGMDKLTKLLGVIDSCFKFEDEFGVTESYSDTLMFYSRFYLAHFIWLAEILYAVGQKNSEIDEIIAFESPVTMGETPYITKTERYLGYFCNILAGKIGAKFINLAPEVKVSKHAEKTRQNNKFLDILSAQIYLFALKCLKKKTPFLITSLGYRLNKLVKTIQKEIPKSCWILLGGSNRKIVENKRLSSFRSFLYSIVWFFISIFGLRFSKKAWGVKLNMIVDVPLLAEFDGGQKAEFAKKAEEFFLKFSKMDLSFFNHQGFSFKGFFLCKLRKSLLPAVINSYFQTRGLCKVLDKLKPRAAISHFSLNHSSSFGELAKKCNLPAVLISHGSFPPPPSSLFKSEYSRFGKSLINSKYPYVAVQSVQANQYLDYFKVGSKRIFTGPLLWGRMDGENPRVLEKIGVPSNKKIILHAGTPKPRDSTYFYVYETLDEYVSALIDLIKAVDQLTDTVLIIKFRPIENLSLDDLKSLLPSSPNFFISVKEPFLDVLAKSDLLVSFSSTTIEEALENNKPVLQYGGNGRLSFLPAVEAKLEMSLQRAPVYFVKNKKSLIFALDKILKLFNGKHLSKEELKNYVIPRSQRQSLTEFFTSMLS